MKVVLHQPQYFPYPGFFHKLMLADTFVLLDNTQYDKRFTNRNKIWTPHGFVWLTVPINKADKFSSNKDVQINNNISWTKEHWKKIFHSYSKSKYFKNYENYLKNLFDKEWNSLNLLDLDTLKQTIEWLGIKIDIIRESELNLKGKGTERLVNGCKALGADTYISGAGLPDKQYMDEKFFEKNNIKLKHQNYQSIKYNQNTSKIFVPDLSILDLLFNMGPDSLKLISQFNEEN